MPKIKRVQSSRAKKLFLEALRYFFFFAYLAALGGMIYFSRSFFAGRQDAEILRQKKILIYSVLPPFDNEPIEESFLLEGRNIFPAKKISKSFSTSVSGESVSSEFKRPAGFAFEAGGPEEQSLKVFMGISPEGKITGIKAVGFSRSEEEKEFLRELEGMDSGWLNTELQAGIKAGNTKKIAEAAKAGLDFFKENREEIFKRSGALIAPPLAPEPEIKIPALIPEIPPAAETLPEETIDEKQ